MKCGIKVKMHVFVLLLVLLASSTYFPAIFQSWELRNKNTNQISADDLQSQRRTVAVSCHWTAKQKWISFYVFVIHAHTNLFKIPLHFQIAVLAPGGQSGGFGLGMHKSGVPFHSSNKGLLLRVLKTHIIWSKQLACTGLPAARTDCSFPQMCFCSSCAKTEGQVCAAGAPLWILYKTFTCMDVVVEVCILQGVLRS